MNRTYTLRVAGLERQLKLYPVNQKLYIAAFILFGDVELTEKCAAELLKKAPAFDILVTAESKGIPLAHEMARQAGMNDYIVCRKGPKVYMEDVVYTNVNSITTAKSQVLCLGKEEIERMKGKRCLIIDDVISTGESVSALVNLVEKVGGEIVGKMAVLAEGDAFGRDDITVLAPLPLFDAEGNAL